MADFDTDEDFYEDDQPVEEVLAAFQQGEKGITGPAMPWSHVVVETTNVGPTGPPPPIEVPIIGSSQVSQWVTKNEETPNRGRLVPA
jgi:hypothetical protein